ncbi:MAG: hypothetical protein JSW07_00110 [bacterium]|nr:MAG: hypothetical protein JSW07_00110 [bacterium]
MRKIFSLFAFVLLPSIVWAGWQISGKVTGADGKPPILAHVHLINFQGNYREPFQTTRVSKDGQFKLAVSDQGLYRLFVTAVNHNYCSIPLIVDNETADVNVDVQLAPLEYLDHFDKVQIMGDWNKFGFNNADNMQKQADGTFTYETEVKADTICYQLIGLTKAKRSVNGTQADYYVYDGGGDYRSVLKVKPGTVKIVFNPEKLLSIKEKKLPRVKFGKQNLRLQKLWDIDGEVDKERNVFQKAVAVYRQTHKDMKDFIYDWSNLATYLKNKMDNEYNITIRQFAAIQLGELMMFRAPIDSTTKIKILDLLPPNSIIWAISPRLPMLFRQDEEQYLKFMKALAEENGSSRASDSTN